MKKRVLSVALVMLVLAMSASMVLADCGTCGKPSCTSCAKPACASTCAPAGCNAYVDAMGAKIYRGAVNSLTGWWEVPAQIGKGWANGCGPCSPNFFGAIGGVFKGLWFAVGRTMSGVGDLVGFWAADPCDNCGIGYALESEYAWSDCPTAACPSCSQPKPCGCSPCSMQLGCLEPAGNKLMRGLGNGLFGIAEVPGQIVKGAKICAPDMGVVKGLWYMLSRTVNGAMDVASFLFPNPTDTKGLKFDEKWPWTAMCENMNCAPCASPCAKPACSSCK